MSSRCRLLWSRISRIKFERRTLTRFSIPKVLPKQTAVPCTLGFSLFTWLGFQTKLSAEDELIQTIKHCILFIQRLEYEKAEQLLHIALRQAQQIHHQLGITYIYDVMANLALEKEQLDKAKQLFVAVAQRVMADGATEDDPRVVHISIKLARISHLKKEYSTAQLGYDWCMQKLTDAQKKDPNEETKKLLAITEDWYGRLFLDCDKIEQGLKLLMSALDRMQTVDDVGKEHIMVQLNDIGTVCDQLGRTDESIEYFKQAIDIGKSLPEAEDLGIMYVNLGRAYLKKQLIEEARKTCGYGWKLAVQENNKEIKAEAEQCLKEVQSKS
ncbi:tetratricopeptide repeat protein 19 homolog, mitochondrial-like [Choristoneura fumiferana]|uniref:tetratricopeptide repeat protein 19 homolog, mitochondrial-like n=1 Tax=Choristoneura fumiferana TaxID=7141 RepID=UPI003D157325